MNNIPSKNSLHRLARNLSDFSDRIDEIKFVVKELLFNMKEIEKAEKELFLLNENDPDDAEEITRLKEHIEGNKAQMREWVDGDKNDLSFALKLSYLCEFHGIEDIVLDEMKTKVSG